MAATTTPQQPKIPRETIEKAVSSLLKWNSSKSITQKPQLLPTDDFIYLVLTLHKIPEKSRTNAYKIPLPNPLYTPGIDSETCLFIDDNHISSKSVKERVLSESIPVSKVIRLSKLRTDYKAFESRRKLCDSYDLFFVDKRIVPVLGRVIGKEFYRKRKVPVPVELGRRNWREQVERVCGSALVYLKTGTCCVVKVAKVSMELEGIVDNVVAAVGGVVEGVVPKGWGNVRSLHLKLAGSVALPVYQAVPEMRMRIESGVGTGARDDNVGGESEKRSDKKKGGEKVVKKKGRIHEVKYMDSVGGFDEMVGGDESGSDDGGGELISGEVSESGEVGSGENVGKKRKKGDGVVKKVAKAKRGEKDSRKEKAKVSGKSGSGKKSKRSKVAV